MIVPVYEGRSAKSWLKDLVLGPDDEAKFTAAQRAFSAMGSAAVPWLADELTKESLTQARAAKLAQAVRAIGPEAGSLIPVLLALVEECPDAVTHALSGLGDKAAPAYIQILRHPNTHVRMRACESLGSAVQFYGVDKHPFLDLIPEILCLLQDEWHMLRWRAAGLLGALCAAPEQCIPALIKCLDDRYTGVQGAAATALGRYGDAASAALPRILKLSHADDVPVRSFAISALGYFSDPRVFPVLIEALKDPSVSTSAIYSLGKGKWPPDTLVPALCDCVKHGDSVQSWAATGILGRLGGQAVVAIPTLRQALGDAKPALKQKIIKALESIEASN